MPNPSDNDCAETGVFRRLFCFSKTEIDAAFKNAMTCAQTDGLKLLRNTKKMSFGKLLLIIPRRVGKAHERNFLRRRLKALFYEQCLYEHPYHFILLANKPSAQLAFDELKNFIINSTQKTPRRLRHYKKSNDNSGTANS